MVERSWAGLLKGSFTPKLCVAFFTLVRPREAIASAIIFCSKTKSRQKETLIGNQLGSVFHTPEWSFLTVS